MGFSLRMHIFIAGRIIAAVMAGDIIFLGCRVAQKDAAYIVQKAVA